MYCSHTIPRYTSCYIAYPLSALEGASLFIHYHPKEQQDASNVKDYISKIAPQAQVELYAKDLRDEASALEMVEAVKKWSGGELHVL